MTRKDEPFLLNVSVKLIYINNACSLNLKLIFLYKMNFNMKFNTNDKKKLLISFMSNAIHILFIMHFFTFFLLLFDIHEFHYSYIE
jgi:hypothetical protein